MAEGMFGPYRLDGLLGRGGMGEVHRAYDTRKRDRVVALKLLPESLSADEEFRARFQREAEIAATLNEPHVIPIHDYGEIDGRLYLDMRIVQGADLATVLHRDGPFTPERAAAIVEQVAAALDAAHDDGLIHRDVKPANVLVRPGPPEFAYLVDFGIARPATPSTSGKLTGTGAALGTLSYMTPEQFLGRTLDRRVDVYALACVLFEILAGRPPFVGAGPVLMHGHLTLPVPVLSKHRPDLPPAIDEVIARGMAKAPADRYTAAGVLAAGARSALVPVVVAPPLVAPPSREQFQPQEAVASPPTDVRHQAIPSIHVPVHRRVTEWPMGPESDPGPGTARIAGSPIDVTRPISGPAATRRGRRRWIGAGALLVTGLAASVLVIGRAPEPVVTNPFSKNPIFVRSLATGQLDGRPVVISGTVGDEVRVSDLATGAVIGQPLSGHTEIVSGVATAQLDGRPVIISASIDRTVRIWDVATHAPIGQPLPYPGDAGYLSDVATAQLHGRTVVIAGGHDGIRVWDLATHASVGEPFGTRIEAVAMAQLDGRPVVVSGDQHSGVQVWDLATGASIRGPLTRHTGIVNAVAIASLNDRPVVVSGADDMTVRLWDLATGRPSVHRSPATPIGCSPLPPHNLRAAS